MTVVRDLKRAIEAQIDRTGSKVGTLQERSQRPFSFVELGFDDGETELRSVGFTRCCYKDWFNKELGLTIARGRAALDLAEQLYEIGYPSHRIMEEE